MRGYDQFINIMLAAALIGIVVFLVLHALAAEKSNDPIPSLHTPTPRITRIPTRIPTRFPTRPVSPLCIVAGCNGELCLPAGQVDKMNSICLYRDEYRCLAHRRCEMQPSGLCGWTPSEAYDRCVSIVKPSVPPPTAGNIAYGKPVIFSVGQVDYKDYAQRLVPANITDGDRTNGWRTETDLLLGSSGSRAVIDLQDQHRLTSIVYVVNWDGKPEFDKVILFRVSYSSANAVSIDDPKAWTVISDRYASMEDNNQPVTVSFLPVSARFIKVEYVHDDDQWAGWGNIEEVEVYGN